MAKSIHTITYFKLFYQIKYLQKCLEVVLDDLGAVKIAKWENLSYLIDLVLV